MTKKVRIRTLGRVIADPPEFVLEGVAGMTIGGSLTVFWSTGLASQGVLEYNTGDSNPDNFTSLNDDEITKYHVTQFPTTFVDTYHYFRVRATNPATGQELVSPVYRVYVTSDITLEARMGFQPVRLEVETLDGSFMFIGEFNYQTNPEFKFKDLTSQNLLTDPTSETETLDLDESPPTPTAMLTNVTTTIN